jgi:hypothetical protein
VPLVPPPEQPTPPVSVPAVTAHGRDSLNTPPFGGRSFAQPEPTSPLGVPLARISDAPYLEPSRSPSGTSLATAARSVTERAKEPPPQTTADLAPLLEEIAREVPEFVAALVLEQESGSTLGGVTAREELDAESAIAYYGEVVRLLKPALRYFRASLDDFLMTSGAWYVLVRPVGDGDYLLGLITTRRGNLGICRRVLKRVASKILGRLPSREDPPGEQ